MIYEFETVLKIYFIFQKYKSFKTKTKNMRFIRAFSIFYFTMISLIINNNSKFVKISENTYLY